VPASATGWVASKMTVGNDDCSVRTQLQAYRRYTLGFCSNCVQMQANSIAASIRILTAGELHITEMKIQACGATSG